VDWPRLFRGFALIAIQALRRAALGQTRPARAISICSHVRYATKSDDRLLNCDPSRWASFDIWHCGKAASFQVCGLIRRSKWLGGLDQRFERVERDGFDAVADRELVALGNLSIVGTSHSRN